MSKINWKYTGVSAVLTFIVISACERTWTCRCENYDGQFEYVIIEKAKEDEAIEVCDSLTGTDLNGALVRRCELNGKYKGPTK